MRINTFDYKFVAGIKPVYIFLFFFNKDSCQGSHLSKGVNFSHVVVQISILGPVAIP